MIITCRCGTPLEVDDDMLGEEIQCPRCHTTMIAPAHSEPAQPSQRTEVTARQPSPQSFPPQPSYSPQPSYPPQPSFPPQPGPASTPQAAPGITSAKAIACLNLGINSFTVPFVLAIPSFVFGLLALRECRKYNMQGKSMAVMGMILSVFSSMCLSCVIWMAYPWIKQLVDVGKGLKDGADITKLLNKGAAGMDGAGQLNDPKMKADYILALGIQKFGDLPDQQTTIRLREITNMDRLNRIENALRTAKTWQELLATP